MLSFNKICIIALVCQLPIIGAERIAVMPFSHGKNISNDEASYITERVRIALIKTEQFDVVSNDQVSTMLKTLGERQSLGDCTSDDCFIKVGKALECRYMLVGKIDNAFGEFSVSGKILNIAEQKYIKADEVTIKQKDAIPESSRVLVDNLTGNLRIQPAAPIAIQPESNKPVERPFRRKNFGTMVTFTILAPGLGHLYAEQSRGVLYGALWVGSGVTFLFAHFFYTSYWNSYETAVSGFDEFYDKAQSWKKIRGYASYVLIGTYAIALLDILISGSSYEKIYARQNRSPEPGETQFAQANPIQITGGRVMAGDLRDETGFQAIHFF